MDYTTTTQITGQDGRSIRTRFEMPGTQQPDGTVAVLEVTTSHWKSHKAYSTGVMRGRVGRERGFEVGHYSPMEATPVARRTVPAARFNLKAMQELHTAHVAELEDLDALLSWATQYEVA